MRIRDWSSDVCSSDLVERLYANQTGMRVRAGQPLLSVYSPQLAAAQQEYRLADETARRLAASDPASAASMIRLRDAARTRLRNWEISDAQLGRTALVLTAPADAVVIEKPVVQGARFEPGETILRLADLSTVWVIAKVPAAQAAGIEAGQPARGRSWVPRPVAPRPRLRNVEISDAQRGRTALVVTAPADAVVIEKPVVQGARFEPGETILRLADLSTVWVIAKVPAAQAAGIEAGQPARFETVALPGQVAEGEVTFVQPVIDAITRTVDVRIALPNPDGDLRPGLYGTVLLEEPGAGPVLTVPRSAVLDSGTRQVVLVESGPGRFATPGGAPGRRGGQPTGS